MKSTNPAKTNHSPVYPRFWNAFRSSPLPSGAAAGTGFIAPPVPPASGFGRVTQAS